MDIDFLPGQQAAGFDNIAGIGSRATCCVHQARISIHTEVPLLASPALVHLFTMHLFLFLVNASAALRVASTVVPVCGIAAQCVAVANS